MIAKALREVEQLSGLRLMDPARDLLQMADLIEEAFIGEIGPGGMAAVRDLRFMARMSPVMWFLDRAAFEFRDSFTGFVWVENGRVVGNVTLSRASPTSSRWHISNVAVRRELRGRGIGRQLVEAGIDYIASRQGEWAILQVRHDNVPALRIYRALGFQDLFLTSEMYRPAGGPRISPVDAPVGYTLRRCRRGDWRREYSLAIASTSVLERWVRGVESRGFRRSQLGSLWERISNWLAGTQTAHFCVDPPEGQELAGRLTVCSRCSGDDNQLSLRVHPRHRGAIETPLISQSLAWLQRKPGLRTVCELSTDHAEGIDALRNYGFLERRRLLTMRRAILPAVPYRR